MAMAYSLHVGSDKNRKLSSKGITTKSGTTSLTNNGIQNKAQLTRCDKHNYRKYDMDKDNIVIIRGTDSVVKDVKDLYHESFDELVLEYNKTKRNDRKIDDYYEHVSLDKNRDLAVEIIIELGDKTFWDTKDNDYKKRMTSVYKKQIDDLELLLPEFKVCSAIIHYDETSPHMHVVGVPIKDGYKNGLSMQVCKSKVFNKTSLMELQDQMRTLCIKDYNEEYNLNEKLKTKEKGRNQDINVKDMEHYAEAQAVLDLESDKLDKINEESLHLDNLSKDIKNELENLKYNKLSGNYVIKKEDKDKIDKYIEEVNKQNEKYKDINNIKNILDIGYDSMKKLETVEEDNKALNIKVEALQKQNKEQKKQIKELDKLVDHFKEQMDKFASLYYNLKAKFDKFIKFIAERLLNPKTKEKYKEFTGDMFGHGVLTYNDSDEIDKAMHVIQNEKEIKIVNKQPKEKEKEKDDFEL
jgi:hypothetical protein